MNKPPVLHMDYGACVPSIADQLAEQGLVIDDDDLSRFQKIADAVTMLKVHGILPDGPAYKARMRLHSRIQGKIKKAV